MEKRLEKFAEVVLKDYRKLSPIDPFPTFVERELRMLYLAGYISIPEGEEIMEFLLFKAPDQKPKSVEPAVTAMAFWFLFAGVRKLQWVHPDDASAYKDDAHYTRAPDFDLLEGA